VILSPPTALYGDVKEIYKPHADVPYTNTVTLAVYITTYRKTNISFRISLLSSTDPVARYLSTVLHTALSHDTLYAGFFSYKIFRRFISPHDTDVLCKSTANEHSFFKTTHFSHALTTFWLRMIAKLSSRIK